ncbi:hypothetical protein AeMF1_001094 [Aphanomyces euteiches]|nr:hypothetical protein AeMF1_001094 [Aphanomyces euteiches]KAH9195199.1 hypothetical protein AeNC1_002835 [Aphanomyces euteiches]
MASEPAWTCVASSAFPLVYSYSKELTLGGRSSRALEKDHAKLIQALEQQLKLKGRSQANKAETLFFYSHFPFLTPNELELVLLRLSEQFSTTNQPSFRLLVLDMFRRLQVHFPLNAIPDASKVVSIIKNYSSSFKKIVAPIAQVVTQHDDVQTRITALQVLAVLAPFVRDDATIHQAILAKLTTPGPEAEAAVATASVIIRHSSKFERQIAAKVRTEPLQLHLMPLVHVGITSTNEAQELWTKCNELLHRGIYTNDDNVMEFASTHGTPLIIPALARLALLIHPNGITQVMDLFRSLLSVSVVNASHQQSVLACLNLIVEHPYFDAPADLAQMVQSVLEPSCSDRVDIDILLFLERVSRVVSLPNLAYPHAVFNRLSAIKSSGALYAHILYNQAMHELVDAKASALQQLFHLLGTKKALRSTVIRLLEGLATAFPLLVPSVLLPHVCGILRDHTTLELTDLWVFFSHLSMFSPLSDADAAFVASTLSKPQSPKTILAKSVALLRSGRPIESHLPQTVSEDPWLAYQMARESMLHGAFPLAARLLATSTCSSERTSFWIAGLVEWSEAEAALIARPSVVPGVALTKLHSAVSLFQGAATSDAPFTFQVTFLRTRIALLSTLQALIQHLLESIIAGHNASEHKLIDVVSQLTGHARQFNLMGNAAWSDADLALLASHGHLCDLVSYAIHRFSFGQDIAPLPTWLGTLAPYRLTSPQWRFICALDRHLPTTPVPSDGASKLLLDLARAAIAQPCGIPRQFFRTTPASVSCDVQVTSPSLKMMSRSVLGIASHSDCHGYLQVVLNLEHVRDTSPLRDSSRKWTLQFDGTLAVDNAAGSGFGFQSLTSFARPADGATVWYGALPLHLDAGRFGPQGTSCVMSGNLWIVDELRKEKWLVALKALERTIVVY